MISNNYRVFVCDHCAHKEKFSKKFAGHLSGSDGAVFECSACGETEHARFTHMVPGEDGFMVWES